MRNYASFLCAMLWIACPTLAVSPVTVEHSTEADFATGSASGVVVTSEGRLQLGRELAVRMTTAQAPAVVSALAVDGKTLYVASGSDNTIYKVADNGASEKFATVDGTIVTSLLWTGKDLLAGTSGTTGAGVYRIDAKGNVTPVWSDEGVQYVWTILRDSVGKLYVATGPKARVYVLDGGQGELLFEAAPNQAKNILCLARDKDGTLYAGTDTTGLVLCIDPVKKTGRVLLNATEKEVAAIVLDGRGGLYAATSDAARATGEGVSQGPSGSAAFGGPALRGSDDKAGKPGEAAKADVAAKPADAVPATMPASAPADANPAVAAAADLPPLPMARSAVTAAATAQPRGPATAAGPGVDGPGNAVYHIDTDGLVRAVFRYPVTIYAMIRVEDALVIGTGNNGQIFRLALDSDQTVMLARAESSQVTTLTLANGLVYFGTANKGSVGVIGASHARTGAFMSKAIDAQQIARWGTVRFWSALPEGTGVAISTRTGNVAEPDEKTWSEWSAPVAAREGFIKLSNPAGRFMQYRLTFTGDGSATAAASDVRVIYQVGNLAPVISAVQIVGGEDGPAGNERAGGDRGRGGPGGADHYDPGERSEQRPARVQDRVSRGRRQQLDHRGGETRQADVRMGHEHRGRRRLRASRHGQRRTGQSAR